MAFSEGGLGSYDLMINGEQLVDILEKHNFCLLIHGHKHHPRIQSNCGNNKLDFSHFFGVINLKGWGTLASMLEF
jgi:UDP-2,3-diacylglucosamine pyrophosphatase LpxH